MKTKLELLKELDETKAKLAKLESQAHERLKAYEESVKRGFALAEKLDAITKQLDDARDAAQEQADEIARLHELKIKLAESLRKMLYWAERQLVSLRESGAFEEDVIEAKSLLDKVGLCDK